MFVNFKILGALAFGLYASSVAVALLYLVVKRGYSVHTAGEVAVGMPLQFIMQVFS